MHLRMPRRTGINKSVLLLALFMVQIIVGVVPLGAIKHASAQGTEALDITGAIQIKDPFAACHAEDYDIMAQLGVKVDREDISWTWIEPTQGKWDWDGWDGIVAGLKAKNMTAEPILDYGNLAVQTGTTHCNRMYTEHDIDAWLTYTDKCAERYYKNDSGYTRYWELWNEPNGGTFNASTGFWTGTDQEYFALQQRTAANLSAMFPGIQLVSAGISGYDPSYLDAMFAAGAMANVNVLAFHPYSYPDYESLDEEIDAVKAVSTKYQFPGQLWITEIGEPTPFDPNATGFESAYQASLEQQAANVPKVYCQALASNVSLVVWYDLPDYNRGGNWTYHDWTWTEANFGLVFAGNNPYKPAPYRNDTLKPSGYAYMALAHQLNWSKYIPRGVQFNMWLPSASKLRTYYFLKANGDIVFICWNGNKEPEQIQFTLPATGVDVWSAPSYKPGAATSYTATSDASGHLTVTASIDFSPTIFVLHRPSGASPVPIVINVQMTTFDFSVLVILPALIAICIAIYLVKSKRRREAKL